MRLISYRADHEPPRLGVVSGDRFVPATRLDQRLETISDLLENLDEMEKKLDHQTVAEVVDDVGSLMEGLRLTAPLARPGKVVCVGRNYREHVNEEEGAEAPPRPLLFSKWPSTIIGPGDPIRWDPELTTQVDYEAELAVVIGRTARRVGVEEALDYVLGYTCLNDVSARDIQSEDGQWVRGKSLDSFCPMGPALVTAEEISDPQKLDISCRVGDDVMQDSNTSHMYFGVAEIISFCSRSFTLEPGDVIATGTPGGVGIFRPEPRLLTDGDVVTVEIESIGALTNPCRFDRS